MKINDFAKSLKTGKKGIIQASYSNGRYLLYHGEGYEHLFLNEMEKINKSQVSFRVANSQVTIITCLTNKELNNV